MTGKRRGRPKGSCSPKVRHDVQIEQPVCPVCKSPERTRLRFAAKRQVAAISRQQYKAIAYYYCRCLRCGASLRFVRYLA